MVSATLVSRALNPKPLVAFQLAADVSVHDGVAIFIRHSPDPPPPFFISLSCLFVVVFVLLNVNSWHFVLDAA